MFISAVQSPLRQLTANIIERGRVIAANGDLMGLDDPVIDRGVRPKYNDRRSRALFIPCTI